MSHDVQFWPRSGALDLNRTRAWFGARPHWTLSGPSAIYDNADTGVYFTVDLNDAGAADESPIVAHLNVYRPSFFGLEAGTALGELSNEFDLIGDDGQDEGGPVPYSREWLVTRWNQSNAAGHLALASRDPSPLALPQSRLVGSWQWNRDRAELQDQFPDLFVPKIMAINTPSGASTAVVWTDAIPFALPPVQHVVVYRNGIPPHRSARKAAEVQLQTREAVVSALGAFGQPRGGRIDFVEPVPPPSVTDWVARLSSRAREFEVVDWDRVHDAELLVR